VARDLIPPPSPAGRPEPESSEKKPWGGEEPPVVAPAKQEAPPPPPQPRVPAPYRPRFGFILGAVIGVALAAVALGAVMTIQAADDPVPAGWSDWRPKSGDNEGAAAEIAAHVAPEYRLSDKNQIAAVRSSPMELQGRKISIALRNAGVGGNIELIDGKGVMYTLNGLGPNGSIKGGKPSEERHLLLRREALELALYTFRYASGVDMVVTLLPPKPPDAAETQAAGTLPPIPALLFRPDDLESQLDVPLTATIPKETPQLDELKLKGPEAQRIDALTLSNLFEGSFTQGQDAGLFLVLDRPQP
jgi:hypothetical protein